MKKELGHDSELVRGSGGIFVVSVDNSTLFSKREEGRFPTEREILDKLRAMS
ncbi:MAG TPA: Rdx family protein [Thermoanaerobaculia bacterium]|nr:Rdx family protein [Thermoanaerobaculia bacterium]